MPAQPAPARTIRGMSPDAPSPSTLAPSETATSDEPRRAYCVSFGCQMNTLDSELVQGDLMRRGYTRTSEMTNADVILINTCSIREHAEDKVWSLLGRARQAKEKRPELKIAVMGCMAIDVIHILEKGRHQLQTLSVRFDGERAATPPQRYVTMQLHFDLAGPVPARAVERAIELSREKYCSVWHTIKEDVELTTAFTISAAADTR